LFVLFSIADSGLLGFFTIEGLRCHLQNVDMRVRTYNRRLNWCATGRLEFWCKEMVRRYEQRALQFPNEAEVVAVVANAYASAKMYDKALAMADHSIALEAINRLIPQA
jgi:hypothetical protein